MSQPLRIAILGAWHVHARDYGRALAAHPDVELLTLWDDEPARGGALAQELGIPLETALDALLARDDVDGVVVTTATREHDAVIGAALAAGRHVFTEKLLSPTVAGCEELIRRADEHGRVLTVSLPRLTRGCVRAVRDQLESGVLGRVTASRVRLAHDGALTDRLPAWFYDPDAAIGGALTDLGAHPACITQQILGDDFETVTAAYADVTGKGVEDNAVVTVTTADGAIGVIETGFVTPFDPFTIEVHGTAGSLHYSADGPRMQLRTAAGTSAVEIPGDGPTPLQQWADAIRRRERTTVNLDRARALTSLIVAANAAAR